MTKMSIEAMVDAVVKRITTTQMGDTVLHPEKAAQLIREIEKATPLLTAARRIDMKSDKRDIDRVGFRERIFGTPPAVEGDPTANEANPTFSNNQLSVVKTIGTVQLTDEALEDGVERENFEGTLLSLIGERAGIDLEELYIKGDVASVDTYLALTDGWMKLAAHKLVGGGATPQFDALDVEDLFETMLVTIINNNPEFMRRRDEFVFWTTLKMENDYREVLRTRGTALGDAVQTGNAPLTYKGIPVRSVFNNAAGTALLAGASNLVYGIRRDIRIEPDRIPKAGRTDFVVTARTDCHYEDQRGAVSASGYTGPA